MGASLDEGLGDVLMLPLSPTYPGEYCRPLILAIQIGPSADERFGHLHLPKGLSTMDHGCRLWNWPWLASARLSPSKPDGVQRGLVADILSRFERKGFKLVGSQAADPQPGAGGAALRGSPGAVPSFSGSNQKNSPVGNRRIKPGAPSLEQVRKKSGSSGRHGGRGQPRGCCGSLLNRSPARPV